MMTMKTNGDVSIVDRRIGGKLEGVSASETPSSSFPDTPKVSATKTRHLPTFDYSVNEGETIDSEETELKRVAPKNNNNYKA